MLWYINISIKFRINNKTTLLLCVQKKKTTWVSIRESQIISESYFSFNEKQSFYLSVGTFILPASHPDKNKRLTFSSPVAGTDVLATDSPLRNTKTCWPKLGSRNTRLSPLHLVTTPTVFSGVTALDAQPIHSICEDMTPLDQWISQDRLLEYLKNNHFPTQITNSNLKSIKLIN